MDVDASALRFLVNPAYQCSLDQTKPKEGKAAVPITRYRGRVSALHKRLLDGEALEPELNAAHRAFVDLAVRYIRFDETRASVEQELEGLVSERAESQGVPQAEHASIPVRLKMDPSAFGATPKATGSLSGFVVRKSTEPPAQPPRRRKKVRRRKKSDGLPDGTPEERAQRKKASKHARAGAEPVRTGPGDEKR